MKKIGLVTTDKEFFASTGGRDTDLPLLSGILRELGYDARELIWHEEPDVSDYLALIIRSPWDYPLRAQQFKTWLTRASSQTRVFNPPELIEWNLDKRYLPQLSHLGVTCPQTSYATTLEDVHIQLEKYIKTGTDYVVKPNISASSRDTGLFSKTSEAALSLAEKILNEGKVVLIQEAIAEVQNNSEHNLVFLGGKFSHAITKNAILAPGGGYLPTPHDTEPVDPSSNEISLGYQTLTAISQLSAAQNWDITTTPPLYARIDMVTTDLGDTLLLEAELFEPSLYLQTSPGAFSRFAQALKIKLET